MFSKSRVSDTGGTQGSNPASDSPKSTESGAPMSKSASDYTPSSAPKSKPPASVLSSDLTIVGNLKTAGDIQIEGTVEGDIRAHLLTIGEGATVRGECMADDVVVNGRVIGKVRGLKVRLTSTARVEGDIIHKTIAIESGAHFEGSVQRQEDPLSGGGGKGAAHATVSTGAPSQRPAPSTAATAE